MDSREHRLLQIASVAESESIGSLLFWAHTCLLLLGALAAYLLFGNGQVAAIVSVYCILFAMEKKVAGTAYRTADVSKYPIVLCLLLFRALTYNALVLLVWRIDGDVFKLVALALLVAATINIMVFHATYRALMICVVVPIWLGFSALALMVGLQEGWSPEAIGAICALLGISPYFLLALLNAHSSWQTLQDARAALNQSQRIEGMGRLAGGVSHDFNNILSVVSGSLQLLESESDAAERSRLIGVANRAIASGASLNKRLLALGKRSTLMPAATDLHDALIEFRAIAETVLPENLRLEIDPSDTRASAFVDAQMLQTALLNLVLNSKSAMPTGGRIVVGYSIAKEQEKRNAGLRASAGFATVFVHDEGVGMDADTLSRAFEPFYTTREVGGGSGLGLPMVKGFAEQSKGRVTLESSVGRGTKVTLFLPLFEGCVREKDSVQTDPPEGQTGGLDAKVLIVEDNVPLLRIIEFRLRRDGLQVVTCENGDQAQQILEDNNDFDLILSDFVMPGEFQGPDLLDWIQKANRPVPFILMSAMQIWNGMVLRR